MNTSEIKTLLNKYFEGATSLEEEEILRTFFTSAQVPEEFQSYAHHFQFFKELKKKNPENMPDDELLFDRIKSKDDKSRHIIHNFRAYSSQYWTKFAAGLALLILGFTLGLIVGNNNNSNAESEATIIKDTENQVLLSALNESSASERILAIKESRKVDDIDHQTANALIKAMNYDDNINVRLAAIETLSNFTGRKEVRNSIIQSLELQDHPVIQIALIDLLVYIDEKNAINEIQRIMIDESIQDVVKQRASLSMTLLM